MHLNNSTQVHSNERPPSENSSFLCLIQNKVDGVVFTSASSVRGFFEIMSKDYSEDVLLENLANNDVMSRLEDLLRP